MKGRSLSVGYIPTQSTLATGEGDGEERNMSCVTIEVRSQWRHRTSSLGLMCGLHVRQGDFTPRSCKT